MRHVIAFLGAASLFSACEREPTAFSRPQQAPDGVLKVVNDHMVSKGTVMADYELDSLSYDYVDRRWSSTPVGRLRSVTTLLCWSQMRTPARLCVFLVYEDNPSVVPSA